MKRLFMYLAALLIQLGAVYLVGWLAFHHWWAALLFTAAVLAVLYAGGKVMAKQNAKKLLDHMGKETPVLKTADGFAYRDLNKNGKLDVYEDSRQPIEARVEDLLSQMTLEEKAAQMLSPMVQTTPGNLAEKGSFLMPCSPLEAVQKYGAATLDCSGAVTPREFAEWQNDVQKLAERTHLGIPVTIASDPRHTYVDESNPLANMQAKGVSSWPIPLGMAAARSEELTAQYAEILRKELTSMGIRFALHPVMDTATDPRWSRANETYGDNADLNAALGSRYILGLQNGTLGKDSVACCSKHFPGAGPQKDGHDAHFEFGKQQVYPNHKLEEHLKPFKAAFKAGCAAVMPYYAMPEGLDGVEEVGFNYNRAIIHDLLRDKLGFDGIVHTDYNIIAPIRILGIPLFPARAWGKGVEKLSEKERICKAIEAGVDQIGGEYRGNLIAALVREGRISESRIDESCRRVLRLKFRLGLFDDPYVDPEHTEKVCGCAEHVRAGEEAMRRSLVLLKNGGDKAPVLPLRQGVKVYVKGMKAEYAAPYAQMVDAPERADFAIVSLNTPAKLDTRDLLSAMLPAGDLTYSEKERRELDAIMEQCPTIVCLKMNRAAVIPEIAEKAAAIFAVFGVKESILMEAIFGKFAPTGKLPFHMACSEEAVRRKGEDVPLTDADSLYPYGFGLTYENKKE